MRGCRCIERARTLLIYGTMLRHSEAATCGEGGDRGGAFDLRVAPGPGLGGTGGARRASAYRRPGCSGQRINTSERRIAEVVAAGMTNKEAAAALFLSVHTVKEQALKRVYRKLGVRSRTELSRRLNGGQ